MRSLKIATGTVLASTALLIAAPMATASDSQCDPATAAATEAESAYKAAVADYQKQINAGGHPGQAEQDNVDQLKQKSDSAASEAQRICGDTVMNPTPTAPSTHKPTGAMHTGSGSTSGDSSTSALAAGGSIAVAAAAGYALVRRARSSRNH
ncbi:MULTISPECIES: hypothetical protein [unclassified Streptomyces]|uniref:hypothetical protein n=1 Tax=unclassified Streptomyces TaxID=2593676 RepID=UPI000DB930F1|nr:MULTISPECIES: hypothetical protein [unclassified Streptomyces]MYT73506.1 hypothetical protein [Streptomyces sp. SID8367]RAJ85040.1 hypothetical protein K377_03521 [Streptomyces sp. PsTaAH-137]